MNKTTKECKIRLSHFKKSSNKEIVKILSNINTKGIVSVCLQILNLEKIQNQEIMKIFDILNLYITKNDISNKDKLEILNYRFLRYDKDFELPVMSYIKLLKRITLQLTQNTNVKDTNSCSITENTKKDDIYSLDTNNFTNSNHTKHKDENNTNQNNIDETLKYNFFDKMYMAISKNIVRNFVAREIYFVIRKIMKKENSFIRYFVQNKYYVNFTFFDEFVEDFYSLFSEIERIEMYLYIKEEYQKDIFLTLVKFNSYFYYGTESKMNNIVVNYLLYDFDVFYDNKAQKMINGNYTLFLDNINDSIIENNNKQSNNVILNRNRKKECSFYTKNTINLVIQKELNAMVDNFNSKKDIESIKKYFTNPFFLLRFSNDTNRFVLGDFLGKEKHIDHLHDFLDTFYFGKKDILEALREFLGQFVLPGEMQIIVRILKEFGGKFYSDRCIEANENNNVYTTNKNNYSTNITINTNSNNNNNIDDNSNNNDNTNIKADTNTNNSLYCNNLESNIVEINKTESNNTENDYTQYNIILHSENDICLLLYSLVMLNTMIHNPNVKHKKNRKMFLSEMKRIQFARNFDDSYFTYLYYEIKKNPIKFTDETKYNVENYLIYKKLKHEISKKVCQNKDKNKSICEAKNDSICKDKNDNICEDKNDNICEDKNDNICEDKNGSICEDKNDSICKDKNDSICKDNKIRHKNTLFFFENIKAQSFSEIRKSICTDCKFYVYKNLIKANYTNIFKELVNNKDKIKENTSKLFNILKHFQLYKEIVDLYYEIYEEYISDLYELFFDFYFEILKIESYAKNVCDGSTEYTRDDNTIDHTYNDDNTTYHDGATTDHTYNDDNTTYHDGITTDHTYNASNNGVAIDNTHDNSVTIDNTSNSKNNTHNDFTFHSLLSKQSCSIHKTVFNAIQKLFILFENDSTKKYKMSDLKRITSRFVRNTASISESNFKMLICENTDTTCQDIYNEVIMKNCYRIDTVLELELIKSMLKKKVFIDSLIIKILEMELNKEFRKIINILTIIDHKKYDLDELMLRIIVETPEIVKNEILNAFIEYVTKKENKNTFIILLHINKRNNMFNLVCMPMVQEYKKRVETIQKSTNLFDDGNNPYQKIVYNLKDEHFSDFLLDPQKLITFYRSSLNLLNYKYLANFVCKTKNVEKECPFKIIEFKNSLNDQILYLLVKDSMVNNKDVQQYTVIVLQVLSYSFYVFLCFLIENKFYIKFLEVHTKKLIGKIMIDGVKKSMKMQNICVCDEKHEVKNKINEVLEMFVSEKIIKDYEIRFYKKDEDGDRKGDNTNDKDGEIMNENNVVQKYDNNERSESKYNDESKFKDDVFEL